MKIITERKLSHIPFDELALARQNIPDSLDWHEYLKKKSDTWYTNYHIKSRSNWLLPQLLAYLAKFTLPRTSAGLIDGKKMWVDNLDPNSLWDRGLFHYIHTYPRGTILGEIATSAAGLQYCALVPLVLAAHKKYNNIQYSEWDRETISSVVERPLAQAMLSAPPALSYDSLLAMRDEAITYKSGAKAGQKVSVITGYKEPASPELRDVPTLAKFMLLQLWCAHPVNRHEYMVLNPYDWDNMPEPLDESVLDEEPKQEKSWVSDIPWEN